MAKKPRFSDFWSGIGKDDIPFPGGYRDTMVDAPSVVNNYEYLLMALRSRAPGQWSQNLLELSRHFTSAAFLAINTLANQGADAEKKVYERTPDPHESDVELEYHEPICRLLEDPNNDDGWGDLMYQIVQNLSLTGIGLVWKPVLKKDDIPTELYNIPSATALPWPPSPVYPHGQYLVQPYWPYGPFSTIPSYQSAAGARIPAEQMMRIKNHHPILKYDGYAVLTALQRQVDTIEAIDLSRWTTQQNGVDPTISLDFDPTVYNPDTTDFKRLRTQLQALYVGPQNAGKIMFNPMGSTVTRLSNTPADMAWQEGWAQLIDFTLAAYGTPSIITGMKEAGSFATLIASLRQFYLISLNPLLSKIAIKFNKHLIRPYYGEELYLKLEGKKIEDEDMQLKKYQMAAPLKTIRMNEMRRFLELAPLQGKEGDQLLGGEEGGGEQQPGMPGQEPQEAMPEGITKQDNDIEKHRPENVMGEGTKGPNPMKSLKRKRLVAADRLAGVLDNAKVKGTALPVEPRKSFPVNGKH